MNNQKEILNFMIELSKEMGKISMKYFRNLKKEDSKNKSKIYDDPVTIADLEISKLIIKRIKKKYGDKVSILCEETELKIDKNKPMFIIDELDGTRVFRDGKENFCHMLCYFDKEPLISVVYVPVENDLYYAIKGKGVYKNDKQIFSSKNNFSKESKYIISVATDDQIYEKFIYINKRFENLDIITKHFYPEIKGSMGIQAISVMNQIIDLTFASRTKVWDMAATYLLVKEAKGKCYILKNEEDLINPKEWNFNEHYKLKQVPVLFTNSYVDEGLFDFLKK